MVMNLIKIVGLAEDTKKKKFKNKIHILLTICHNNINRVILVVDIEKQILI